MIFDFLTVFFLVAGFLLLIRLIRQRRRTLAKVIIEERVRELEPPTVGAPSFGRRGTRHDESGTIFQISSDHLISKDGLQQRAPDVRPDKERAWKYSNQDDFDLSQSISEIEGLISNNVQNNVEDRFITDVSAVKARPKMTSSDPAEEHSVGTPAKGPSVETQTPEPAPEPVLEHRNTIISADDDLAKMLRKIGPDL
ncbi:MAG: hypothetical protein P4M05_17515 [Bradyrhizobium sp.]|nr:hypothetical protein [Bradyrhizobium sp.]